MSVANDGYFFNEKPPKPMSIVGHLARVGAAPLTYARTVAGSRLSGIFCSGFLSNMHGEKALRCEQIFWRKGFEFIRFDYTGVAASAMDKTAPVHVRFKQWKQDVVEIIDNVATRPVVLVGSSMGGWLSLWAAIERPELVKGIVLLAPSVDFMARWIKFLLTLDLKPSFEAGQSVTIPGPYGPFVVNKALAEESQSLELYPRFPEKIPVRCPIRIIHGQKDDAVAWTNSLKLIERLESSDVDLILIKSGDHRLSKPEDLFLLEQTIDNLLYSICPPSIIPKSSI